MIRFKFSKISQDEYQAILTKNDLENCGVSMETLMTPDEKSIPIISEMGQSMAALLINRLAQDDDSYLEKYCEVTGYVTEGGLIYTFDLYDTDELPSDIDLEDDEEWGALANEIEPISDGKSVSIIFYSMRDCLEFYKLFLYRKAKKVEMFKHYDEYGLYVEASPKRIERIKASASEYFGEVIHVSHAFLIEKKEIIVKNGTLIKMAEAEGYGENGKKAKTIREK